jgi:hypothetical protein
VDVNCSERVLVTKNKDVQRAAVRSIDWLDAFMVSGQVATTKKVQAMNG